MNVVEKIFTEILTADQQDQRFILGIDGLSRSGKTSFVKRVASNLKDLGIPFHVIHIDDHIVERAKRYNTGQEEWCEYYYFQWDVEWLKVHLFGKLLSADQIELPFYDDELDEQTSRVLHLTGKKVLIVEGVFLMREEWKNYFDFTVFLDCPRDVRFSRESAKTQSNIEKFKKRYWKAEDFYLETVKPAENTDLVISWQELVGERLFASVQNYD
ncbi:kinase [Mesobacillus subterraneus]|uniref:kinase n=1 Tax=Mesobacillus subterraneus TaxID=285983 RepID=UPI00203B5BF8|nr:kinase [Mesobacillus subterraneus]MCM3666191.1 kinase [Mesobacillus subterraneus]MCM3685189.1 kinase [Mesobacillus subterraneus]